MLRPLHEGISVADMDASVAWYEKFFGFSVVKDDFVPDLNSRIVFLRLGDFELELFEYRGTDRQPLPEGRRVPNEDIKTCGVKHVAWAVDSMEAELARLRALGADIAAGPFPMAGDTVCFLRDNSGNLMELIEPGA